MGDFIKDNQDQRGAGEGNPGLSAEFPDVQFHSGGANVTAFDRMEPLGPGHQRWLAEHGGSGSSETPASHHVGSTPAFYQPKSAIGSNTDELLALTAQQPAPPFQDAARGSEFARPVGSTVAGLADTGATAMPRGPVSPEQALGLNPDQRLRADNLQADRQPSPIRGNAFPSTFGREGNSANGGDRARHVPREGGYTGAPSWKAGHVVKTGQATVEAPAVEQPKSDSGTGRGRVIVSEYHANPIVAAAARLLEK